MQVQWIVNVAVEKESLNMESKSRRSDWPAVISLELDQSELSLLPCGLVKVLVGRLFIHL